MSIKFQYKRGTAAYWASVNPILAQGEPGYELGTGKQKIGDGATAWNALSYFTAAPSSGGLPVFDLVNDYGCVGNDSFDNGSRIDSALSDAHTAGGGTLYGGPGVFRDSHNHSITDPRITIMGQSPKATVFKPTGHGNWLDIKTATVGYGDEMANTLERFSVDGGAAQSDTVALHMGDTANGVIDRVGFYNLTGASAIAMFWQNQGAGLWTEGWTVRDVEISNCKTGWLLDRLSGSHESMGYNKIYGLRMDVAAGQTGIIVQGGVRLYNAFLHILANLYPDASTTFMEIIGIPGVGDTTVESIFDILVEQTGGSPSTAKGIVLSNFGVIAGHGYIDLSSNSPVSSIGTGQIGPGGLQGWMKIPGFPDNALPYSQRELGYTIGSPATHYPTTPSTVGQIYRELTPVSGGQLGWICTTAGTPGVWKAFGAIS